MIKLTNELIIEIEGYGNIVLHKDTTLYDLIKRLNKTDDIIACSINNEIVELSYKLKEDTKLKLISIKDRMGAKIYRSGLKFIYITAIKELFGINTDVKLLHSLDKGIYTRIDLDLTVDIVKDIKAKMEELVSRDLRFEKITTRKTTAKKTETVTEVYVQYWGKEIHTSEVADRIRKIWTDDMGKKASDLKDLKIYIKPEDNGAHYVINGDVTGFIGL